MAMSDTQHLAEARVVEAGGRQRDRDRVEPREVAAQHEPALRHDDQRARDRRHRLRREEPEGHDELRDVVGQHLHLVQRRGQVMEPPAQRVGHRLGLVVVPQAREVTPAGVAAELDQAGAELHPEEQPAHEPDRQRRGRHAVRSEEHGEETGLEQERLPPEGVEGLAHVDDRQVQPPQRRPHEHRRPQRRCLREPCHDGGGQRDTGPRDGGGEAVGPAPVEEARRLAKGHQPQETRRRQEAVVTDQRAELVDGDQERDEVDDAERPLEHEPAQPVPGRREPSHARAHDASPRRGPARDGGPGGARRRRRRACFRWTKAAA